jgi:hypothetical protein
MGGAVTDRPFTYMTFHRVRFSSPLSAHETSITGPGRALHWLFGPDSPQGDDGLRTRVSTVWGGAGFYADIGEAEATIVNLRSELAFGHEVAEAWHAILCPISHKGETNWFGSLDRAASFVPVKTDPGGALIALTSAGYNALPPAELKADLPRRIDFIANVDRVRAWYATLPGSVALGIFNPNPIGTDGLTFSLWRDDEAMMAAAYRPGIHRTQLDRYKVEHTADRSSFTRARILRCIGTWDGVTIRT